MTLNTKIQTYYQHNKEKVSQRSIWYYEKNEEKIKEDRMTGYSNLTNEEKKTNTRKMEKLVLQIR